MDSDPKQFIIVQKAANDPIVNLTKEELAEIEKAEQAYLEEMLKPGAGLDYWPK